MIGTGSSEVEMAALFGLAKVSSPSNGSAGASSLCLMMLPAAIARKLLVSPDHCLALRALPSKFTASTHCYCIPRMGYDPALLDTMHCPITASPAGMLLLTLNPKP